MLACSRKEGANRAANGRVEKRPFFCTLSPYTRLDGWTKSNNKERNRGVIMCIVVGDVPSGGYMLRFMQ